MERYFTRKARSCNRYMYIIITYVRAWVYVLRFSLAVAPLGRCAFAPGNEVLMAFKTRFFRIDPGIL